MTAWSGFQSAKWSGVQARLFNEATASRAESVRASTIAGQQAAVDASVFTSWLTAAEQGESGLAALIEARFRDEFAPAFAEWQQSNPFVNTSAAPTPFALASYQLAATGQANLLDARATTKFEEATRANQRSDNYVLMTVIAAAVLFLGAVSTRFGSTRLQTGVLIVATTGLLAAAAVTVSFPIRM